MPRPPLSSNVYVRDTKVFSVLQLRPDPRTDLVDVLLAQQREPRKQGLDLPLKFASPEEEIGLCVLFEALRFGSGWSDELMALSKRRDFVETTQFGVLSMFLSQKLTTSDSLVQASAHAVGLDFDFPVSKSVPVSFASLGGVYQEVDGPLHGLADAMARIMNEIGVTLRARSVESIGHLVRPWLADASPSSLLSKLQQAFPLAFVDSDSGHVFNAKAQRLVYELLTRFTQREVSELEEFTACVDAELLTALVNAGLLERPSKRLVEKGSKEEIAYRESAKRVVHELCLALRAQGVVVPNELVLGRCLVEKYGGGSGRPVLLCKTTAY